MPASIRSRLLAGTALALLATPLAGPALAQSVSVDFQGATFTNQGLVGVGRVPAQALDFFGDTFGSGSGLVPDLRTWRRTGDTYTGTLFLLPDRGYNNATVGTTDYQGRLQRLGITLSPYSGAAALPAGPGQQSQVGITQQATIGLTDVNGTPTTGLDPTGVRAAAQGLPALPQSRTGRVSVDNEAVVRSRDGSFWISDEYGAYIYRYDANGRMIGAIRPPDAFIPIRNGVQNFSSGTTTAGQTTPTPVDPVTGRQNNQGFEGLGIAPNGRALTTLLQSATRQDGGDNTATRFYTRMLTYNIANPAAPSLSAEYVIRLPQYVNSANQTRVAAQSEILQLNNTQFLMLSRDSSVGFGQATAASAYRTINLVDVSNATNIGGSRFDGVTPVAPGGVLAAGITPALVTPFLDINDNRQLNRFGLRNGTPNDLNNLYEKWEGMALLPVLDRRRPNDFFLVVANDNDFTATSIRMNGQTFSEAVNADSMFLVYQVTLPTYIDPLALQSLETTALPLARVTGETASGVARTLAGAADVRLFGLRTLTSDIVEANRPAWNTYITGNFNWERLGASSEAAYAYGPGGTLGRASADPNIRQVTVGADYRIAPNTRIGMAITYFDATASLLGSSRTGSEGAAFSPYVTGSFGNTWYDFQYSFAPTSYDIRRDTGVYGLIANARPSGQTHVVSAAAGHNFRAGPVVFGPTFRATYANITVKGYTERDAILANATQPRQTINTGVINLGGQISYPLQLGDFRVVPQVRAGYDIDVAQDKRNLTISLAERASLAEARVTGPVGLQNQSGFRGGAGVLLRRDNMSLLVDYDVRARRFGTTEHLVTVSLGYAF